MALTHKGKDVEQLSELENKFQWSIYCKKHTCVAKTSKNWKPKDRNCPTKQREAIVAWSHDSHSC